MKNKEIFKKNIKLVVNQLVGDQKKLVPIFKVSEQTISNYMTKSPSLDFLLYIEEKTGVSPYVLYNKELTTKDILTGRSRNNTDNQLSEPESPKYQTPDKTIERLAKAIEMLTMQINEIPALREKVAKLEKEMEEVRKGKE